MSNYQATWRAITRDGDVVVDRVSKVYSAPNLLEAKRIASQLLPSNMTLVKVTALSDEGSTTIESDPGQDLNL